MSHFLLAHAFLKVQLRRKLLLVLLKFAARTACAACVRATWNGPTQSGEAFTTRGIRGRRSAARRGAATKERGLLGRRDSRASIVAHAYTCSHGSHDVGC